MLEPTLKKAKITGHFRVALRPQDINVQRGALKKHKKVQDTGQENKIIDVITISDDDDDDDEDEQQQTSRDNKHPQQQQQHQQSQPQSQLRSQSQPQHNNYHLHHRKNAGNNKPEPQVARQILAIKSINNNNNNTKNTHNNNNINQDDTKTPPRLNKSTNFDSCRLIAPRTLNVYIAPPGILPDVVDHDKFLLSDINSEPHYAWDSFQYDREQELKFKNRRYLADEQHDHQITPHIRARLVDWLVQIQDSFSLYHESLYMAVKLADQYLMRKTVPKQHLQLLYMTTILISAKFDERLPPMEISDLIKHSGGIYSRKQVISFEVEILSTLDFNIRFPLSYGFLRRYSRCTRSDQRTLTLARYILESSLLDYEMIEVLESEIAAASLLLAFQMLNQEEAWTETAQFYTGYEQEQLQSLAIKLNKMISKPTDKRISTVRNKYSHEVFMSVARIPPLCL